MVDLTMVDEVAERCPECGGPLIFDHSRGEKICARCGLVVNEHEISFEPEWRAFSWEDVEKRARAEPELGMSTFISRSNVDGQGKKLNSSCRFKMFKLRLLDKKVRNQCMFSRSFMKAISLARNYASKIGLSNKVVETAILLLQKIFKTRMTRGYRIDFLARATLYIACRIHKIPRPLDDFQFDLEFHERKLLRRAIRRIMEKWKIDAVRPSPIDFLSRFASELQLSQRVVSQAREILKKAENTGICVGKDPTGMAGAALYIAGILTGEKRTQKQISKVVRATEVTIRNRYKELVELLGIKLVLQN
ncbi:MAG: transcription initiation factor IIB [Thermofilum sp. ex4484_82]|nr:MAG: transcription initiation factor IIB [Thermofilum sp. ex4484_82]OYT40136.1 MAG: transcription initiation factor IIB [Archaeoglobales archaeon ex4484_92]